MVQQDDLDRIFASRCDEAWRRLEAGEFDEGYLEACRLLSEPLLGELLAARCHLLLTSSDGMAVEHGKKACELYRKFLENAGPDSPVEFYNEVLGEAQRRLVEAYEREAAEKGHWAAMTDQEIVDEKRMQMKGRKEMAGNKENGEKKDN